jgi:hypothetical protein
MNDQEIGTESAWWIGHILLNASAEPQELASVLGVPVEFVTQCQDLARRSRAELRQALERGEGFPPVYAP